MTTEAKKHSVLKEYEPKQEQAIKNSKSKIVKNFLLAGIAVVMLSGCGAIQQPNQTYNNGQYQQQQYQQPQVQVIPADEIFATRADTGKNVKLGIYQDSIYATAQQMSAVVTMTALLTDQAIGIDSFSKTRETAYNRLRSGATTGHNILDVAGSINRFFNNDSVDSIISDGRNLISDAVSVGANTNKLFRISDKTTHDMLVAYAKAHNADSQRKSHNLSKVQKYGINGEWEGIHANANNATIRTFEKLCKTKSDFLNNVANFVISERTDRAQTYLAKAMDSYNQIIEQTTQLNIDNLVRTGAIHHVKGNKAAGDADMAQAQKLHDQRKEFKTNTGNNAINNQINLFNTGNAYE